MTRKKLPSSTDLSLTPIPQSFISPQSPSNLAKINSNQLQQKHRFIVNSNFIRFSTHVSLPKNMADCIQSFDPLSPNRILLDEASQKMRPAGAN
jgi:hypothetical protein